MSAPPPVAEPVASPAQDASQESRPDGRAAVKWVAQAGALFAIYVATALLGLSQKFDPVSGFATLVWAPTGLALAALVTSRRTSLWPAIALGAFAANMSQGAPPLVAGAIALGNTAEAVLGAFLLRRSGFRPSLERLRDVLVLIAFAAIVSTTVSATVGVLSLLLGGVISTSAGPEVVLVTWRAWWLGDAMGDLVLAPLLLVLGARPPLPRRALKVVEGVGLIAGTAITSLLVHGELVGPLSRSYVYLVFPFLIWASVRFGQLGGTGATFVASAIAIGAAVRGAGPFAGGRLSESLFFLELFMAVVSVTALVLSAALAERATAIADRDRANRELAGRNEELARSNRELESFATVASHDLQEPLRKVLVFGDRLGARVGGLLDVEGKDHLDRILKASSRMQKLIDDLLAFSRVSTRAEPFVPVALGEVARGVISDLEASIEKTQARVEVGALPTIVADPAQMRQLLQNLVGNALKFHEESKPPVVRIRSEPGPAPRTFRILVEDEGIGFDEKYLDRIFTLFHRLNSRDRYDGTGVGLATCRKIVERHGGSITATSKPGQGSVFAVIIPSERSRGDSA